MLGWANKDKGAIMAHAIQKIRVRQVMCKI